MSRSSLKTLYASPISGATTEGSITFYELIPDRLHLGVYHDSHAILDRMAIQEGNGGLQWLDDIDVLALTAEGKAKAEGRGIGKYGLRDISLSFG